MISTYLIEVLEYTSIIINLFSAQIDSYSMPPPPPHAMGRSAFFAQLAILRPYTDTFLNMIQEAKDRNHSLAANDDRALVYRWVVFMW